MAPTRLDFRAVARIGLALPGVELGTTYGTPALKLRGRLLTCRAIHRSAEHGSIVVPVGFDERAQLVAARPDVFYLTPHYVKHPVVLVRLSRINRERLEDLLMRAWRFVDGHSGTSRPRRTPRAARGERRSRSEPV